MWQEMRNVWLFLHTWKPQMHVCVCDVPRVSMLHLHLSHQVCWRMQQWEAARRSVMFLEGFLESYAAWHVTIHMVRGLSYTSTACGAFFTITTQYEAWWELQCVLTKIDCDPGASNFIHSPIMKIISTFCCYSKAGWAQWRGNCSCSCWISKECSEHSFEDTGGCSAPISKWLKAMAINWSECFYLLAVFSPGTQLELELMYHICWTCQATVELWLLLCLSSWVKNPGLRYKEQNIHQQCSNSCHMFLLCANNG